MKLKIDLEKAYDKLEWSFIRETLIKVNMPEDLIDLIMSCVTLVSTSILFNEEALDPIYPTRGIRQGGSLSPYLFILCMDFLGQLIEEKCSKKLWQPVKASQRGPAFSHLLFANDLVVERRGGTGAVDDGAKPRILHYEQGVRLSRTRGEAEGAAVSGRLPKGVKG